MKNTKRTPEDNKTAQLENEVARLNKKIAKYEAVELKQNRFGLVWLDVPEAFENDVENKLSILEEVPKLAINNKDGKPTHLLIEGDNYHALTCLNYTHKGKVDVIYIDPPYNTGSDGFKYKDKRILKEYPDGTEVPVDHPLRHSYWLSFMKKRLELARDILSNKGVIFINIDDNEYAQLKLLCDEIFSNTASKGYIGTLIWQRAKGGGNSKKVVRGHEYILCYCKSDDLTLTQKGDKAIEHYKKYKAGKLKDKYVMKEGKLYFVNDDIIRRVFGKYKRGTERRCEYENLLKFKGEKVKKEIDEKIAKGEYILKQNGGGYHYICRLEEVADMRQVIYTIIQGFLSEVGKNDLAKLGMENLFDYPKPVGLIKLLLDTVLDKNAVILDFFAGSGTTGQATMELNEEDKGGRQFILITDNNEITNGQKHKIMTDICYPRIKNVIKGYNSKKGLGNSVRYFKTAFVGKNNILKADDADKIELAHNASGMLAIAENTFDQVEQNNYWQIFESPKQYTAIYFREEFSRFDDFVEKVKKLKKPTVVYIFSWEKEFDFNDFDNDKNIKIKTIPQPILEIYKQIYNLV